jgi:SAM-dependent methyltransferase
MPGNQTVEVGDEAVFLKYTEKYGPGFIFDIDIRDEMFRHQLTHAGEENAVFDYLRIGEEVMNVITEMSRKANIDLHSMNSILDFASGYGRFTRFLIQKTDPASVWVSDIDHDAVDFCVRTFGVRGFYSARDPADCEFSVKYQMIIVISLFSHLSIGLWEKWMARLYGSLEDDGVIIFTTHGTSLLKKLKIDSADQVSRGFFYIDRSETERLPKEDYGSVFVSKKFVQTVLTKTDPASRVHYFPKRLDNFQDVYMVKKMPADSPVPGFYGKLQILAQLLKSSP